MQITTLNSGKNWLEAHASTCKTLARSAEHRHNEKHGMTWTEDHDTILEAAASICTDFIAEGSMTLEESVDAITWHSCLNALPMGGEAPRKEYRKGVYADGPKTHKAAARMYAKVGVVAKVAAHFGCSPTAARRWIRQGEALLAK